MKRVLLLMGLGLIFSAQSYSQLEKGTIMLGGFSNVSFNTNGEFELGLHPDMGYFVGEQLCLGALTPIHFYSSEQADGYYIGVSPFARYYFGENDQTRFFGLAMVNLKLNDNVYIRNRGWIDLGAGYVWFINKTIGLEAEFICNLAPDVIQAGLYFGVQIYLSE